MTLQRRTITAATALAAWFAVVLDTALAAGPSEAVLGSIVRQYAFFTIWTNTFVALVATLPLVAPSTVAGRFFARAGVATTATAAIVVVGSAYHLLLRDEWWPSGWRMVSNICLHYVVPSLCLAHWLFAVPKAGLRFAQIPRWTVYPLSYVAFLFLRGEVTGRYPYSIVDVERVGYVAALLNTGEIFVAFVAVSALLVGVGKVTRAAA